ncbi:MAG: FAD-dependent oxidoreductase [Candidatus Parcubacteria bacterium]|nr:FAD-dependent oxidoreductase [Candidatus Parcubacteria bacterium]
MKIAIIGAGFTGLSCAYQLIQKGHEVVIFEKEGFPGGLAVGFGEKDWQWSLETHYHHWFTNDKNALDLAKDLNYPVMIKRPKTSVFVDNNIYQLDSVADVLRFPKLTITERLRMGTALGLLKYNPFWQPLEKYRASVALPKMMGKRPYAMLWEQLLVKKFGLFANDISLAWFWARIKKRTPSLAYPEGGFLKFAQAIVKNIEQKGGKVLFNTEVIEIKSKENITICHTELGSVRDDSFDKVIVTLPSFFFMKLAPQLPIEYKKRLMKLKGLGAINLILRLKEQFFKDGAYWLSICDKKSPIMAVVEHTNFMDKKYYNDEHLVYVGNYVPHDHPYMKMTANELLVIYDPYLRRINKNYKLSIINCKLFKAPFAQPIIPINYSKIMPPFETPLKNVYLANIQQVYPWDRGTNYAIELGEKVAKLISLI